jgi:NAD(P)-dependent dehydrogenase (short-subunit alcohol dehydrogenase family)
MTLKGKRVAVIGGTSGIGLAIAQASLDAGAAVTIASRRPASVDAAAARLGPGATGATVDVLDAASVAKALGTGDGPVDHLIYTAGEPLTMMPVAGLDLGRAQQFFSVRYFGALNTVHAALPYLAPQASITLTSGTAGERAGSGWALGASVCGAVNSLIRALAVELAPVRVNAVAPGVLRSEVWAEMSEPDRERMYDQIGHALPLGRVGEPGDAAEAYLYCMQQAYTTGAVIPVDGGTLLV